MNTDQNHPSLSADDVFGGDENFLMEHVRQEIERADSVANLEHVRLHYVGKQGVVTLALKSLGKLSVDERRLQGPKFNALREYVSECIQRRRQTIDDVTLDATLAEQTIDVSRPVYGDPTGSHHVISVTLREISTYFQNQGFDIGEGPDIDDAYHNFDALNIPAHHPARQSHDTFYMDPLDGVEKNLLLRTHTSTVQIRATQNKKPPLRILAPGRVYRSDFDATHLPMFHQIEGFVIEEGIHLGHLKGTLTQFCRDFFNKHDLEIRFRPSFFPFTEPSFEVDMWWHDRWLEVLGCGMIHPNVLKNMGLDPSAHQGFAFGLGVDRFAMLKYNVKDIRHFTANDMRWMTRAGVRRVGAF